MSRLEFSGVLPLSPRRREDCIAVLTTVTLVSQFGVSSIIQGVVDGDVQATGLVAEIGFYAVLAYASIVAWGIVLFLLSPRLARYIVK